MTDRCPPTLQDAHPQQAARLYGPRDLRLEPFRARSRLAHEALVDVLVVGLCGSDCEEFLRGPIVARLPRVLGHEIVGIGTEAAADGSGPKAGTRVVVDVVRGCGTCLHCAGGEEGRCENLSVLGQHEDGGLATSVVCRADRLIALPPSLPSWVAAFSEPLAVSVRALRAGSADDARSAVVIGAGTIGMLTAQLLRHHGVRTVVVIEPSELRRDMIASWGVRTVWDDDAAKRLESIRALIPPPGPDVVFECVGRPGVVGEALAVVRRGGRVVALGVSTEPESVNLLELVVHEKQLIGSAAHRWDLDVGPAVDLLACGAIDVSGMVSARMSLHEAKQALTLAATGGEAIVKVLVESAEAKAL